MKGISGRGDSGRYLLAILSVVLGIAFMSGACFIRSSVTTTLNGAIDAMVGADVYVMPKGSTVADVLIKPNAEQEYLDSTTTSTISVVQDLQGALPMYVGPVVLLDQNNNEVSSGKAPSIAMTSDPNEVENGRYVSGEAPASIQEIALEENTAQRAGISLGDPATVIANGSTLEMTVVGIVSFDASLGGSVVVIMNGIVARAIYSPSGMIPYIATTAKDSSTPQSLKDSLSATLGTDYPADIVLGSQARSDAVAAVNNSFIYLDVALACAGALALVIAGFLVFTVVASQKKTGPQSVATLKVLGVSSSQIRAQALRQAALVGIIGSVLGILVGFVFAQFFRTTMAVSGLRLATGIPWVWLGASLVVGVALSLLCSWLAVSSVLSSKDVLTAQPVTSAPGLGIARTVIGAVVLVAGIVVLVLKAATLLYFAIGAGAVIAGAALAGPALVTLLAQVFGPILGLFSSVPAKIARTTITGTPRRAANLAGIFTVAISVAVCLLTLAGSWTTSQKSVLDQEVTADFVIDSTQPEGIISDTIAARILQVDGVQVTTIGRAPVSVQLGDADSASDDTPPYLDASVYFAPAAIFTSGMGTAIVSGNAEDFAYGVAVNKVFADANNLHVGDSVNLTTARNTPYELRAVPQPVALIIDSKLFPQMVVSSEWLIQQVPGHTRSQFMPVTVLLAIASDPAAVDTVGEQLRQTVDPYHTIEVRSQAEFVSAVDPGVGQATMAAYIVLVLCVVVALIALIAVMSREVAQRHDQFAMLKAMGMASGQVGRVITCESVIIALSGSVLGIVIGVVVAFVGKTAIGLSSLTIPWLWIIAVLVGAVVVGLVGAIVPASRAGRLSIREGH